MGSYSISAANEKGRRLSTGEAIYRGGYLQGRLSTGEAIYIGILV
jgi:hypothetical protein